MIDSNFEYITAEILTSKLDTGIWFDGTNDLRYEINNPHKISFYGNMQVCLNQDKFWIEPFTSVITDERHKGGGFLIYVKVGTISGNKVFNIL